ncbi:hypothetical protein HZS_355 [Henneguya salminicola]|nr:hypothetical protein HZS_355 [Henneguya salminicola]
MIGTIKELDENNECRGDYYKRFLNWATLNNLDEKSKIRALIVMGGQIIFATLKAQLKGVDPCEIEICQAKELLSAHFSPKPLILSERYKFWATSQMEQETISEYSLRIQKMSEFCDFQEFFDQALRDQFIMGFRDVQINIRALLLAEAD